MTPELEFIAAGGNRHSSAADWASGLLAFGSDNNIAIWNPQDPNHAGIRGLLVGHTDTVHAVKIYDDETGRRLISGSADNTIRFWDADEQSPTGFRQTACLSDHTGSVNTLSISATSGIVVSGAADGTVRVYHCRRSAEPMLLQTITLNPRFLPLATAVTTLPDGAIVLAVAGTCNVVQIYFREQSSQSFALQATLTGHEGWIRSLDFTHERSGRDSDLLLASASQDKYVRLWRFARPEMSTASASTYDPSPSSQVEAKTFLSNKLHTIGTTAFRYTITFEALLIGHEDWIYTARWSPTRAAPDVPPALLTASADNSLSIWYADPASGVWICGTRLGEISSQKGSTTATGSTGGFWVGLWRPDGASVSSLGRTGSWRVWTFDATSDVWTQQVGITGHAAEVQAIAWSPDGSYLLSTGSDQTTRLYCQWRREGNASWHEFARPQIHGYDLNCLATINNDQMISGADEKLLRVFNKPKAIDTLLSRLCGVRSSGRDNLADAANIPVLGLSNKAVSAMEEDEAAQEPSDGSADQRDQVDPSSIVRKSTLDLNHPPYEDHLARHTLWPEHEKLYGHGYEISAVATSTAGSLVATACKASSIDHATVRIYDTQEWREIKPPLTAHSLTVTALAFSGDDRYLLSVGRDRQWTVFERSDNLGLYHLKTSNPRGHSRMILDCSWAPISVGYVFATAGRDKTVKIWKLAEDAAECVATLSAQAPVTAVAFDLETIHQQIKLAYAWEDGGMAVATLDVATFTTVETGIFDRQILPGKNINSLKWRPRSSVDTPRVVQTTSQLAIACDDGSVRMYHAK